MIHTDNPKPDFRFAPLGKTNWKDFEQLFGERGACGGCWCMWWRLTRPEFEQQKGGGNKTAIKNLVEAGKTLGILAYDKNNAVGWCAIAPREEYPRLDRSRILQKVDDKAVWSVTCFFIDKKHRKQGLTIKLLNAAGEHVKEHGGRIIEGYPVEPKKESVPDVFVYTGLASAFRSAGFKEVLRRSETRPIMRYEIE
jgi:GNAT superfamily N-acetyltransferase